MTEELKNDQMNMAPVEKPKKPIDQDTRAAVIFAIAWGLLIGVGGILRLDDLGTSWQAALVTIDYLISGVLYFIAAYLFWKGKNQTGRIL